NPLDMLRLDFFKRCQLLVISMDFIGTLLQVDGKIFDIQKAGVVKGDGALNQVFQLTHIPRPGVVSQCFINQTWGNGKSFAELSTVSIQEVSEKKRQVGNPLPKRRQNNFDNVEPIEKILSELAILNERQ